MFASWSGQPIFTLGLIPHRTCLIIPLVWAEKRGAGAHFCPFFVSKSALSPKLAVWLCWALKGQVSFADNNNF